MFSGLQWGHQNTDLTHHCWSYLNYMLQCWIKEDQLRHRVNCILRTASLWVCPKLWRLAEHWHLATWTHTPVPLCPEELPCCDLVFQDSPLTHQGIYTCMSFLEEQKYLSCQRGNSLNKSAFPNWAPGMKQVCVTWHMLCLQLEANPETGIWVGGGDLGGGKSPLQGRTWSPCPTKSPWFGLEMTFSRNSSLLYCKWFDDIMVTFTSDLFQMIPYFWNPEPLPASDGTHLWVSYCLTIDQSCGRQGLPGLGRDQGTLQIPWEPPRVFPIFEKGGDSFLYSRVLNLYTIDILDWNILCGCSCPMLCKMFSSISGFYWASLVAQM